MRVLIVLIASYALLAGQRSDEVVEARALSRLTVSVPAVANGQGTALPQFEDYPSTEVFTGGPAPVVVGSARYGRMFRTRIRDGARKGPNFAGRFTVVVWGCGSSCQIIAVVDAKTGGLSEQTLRTTNGVEYRRESRLLIADPVHAGDSPLDTCAACGFPAAYEWTGVRFEPIGPGSHPHLFGERPW